MSEKYNEGGAGVDTPNEAKSLADDMRAAGMDVPELNYGDFSDAGPENYPILDALLGGKKRDIRDNTPSSVVDYNSGFGNTPILEPIPNYNKGAAEDIFSGTNSNTIIILGRDRPRGKKSGRGKGANSHVGCIDIIAGLSGILSREVDAQGKLVATNKSPELDSARIYITQHAEDIDGPEYFNLATGNVGRLTGRSAIVLKADSTRIIGREGIKLITSSDTRSGASSKFIGDNIQGIDLIAGNDDSGLQPMVKGDDLAAVLDNLVELISDVQDSAAFSVQFIATVIASFIDVSGTAAEKLQELIAQAPQEVVNLSIQELNFIFHRLNYDERNPFAKRNFRSKWNHVN